VLEPAPGGVASSSSRAALARSSSLLAAGVVVSLLGLIDKQGIELRALDTLLVALGVPLASIGLVGIVAPRRELTQGRDVVVQGSGLLPSAALLSAGLLGLRTLLHAAIAGTVPAGLLCMAVPACVLLAIAGLGSLVERCRGESHSMPLWRRGWLVALAVVAYVPTLGSFGLIDPWESQYSEVAREMLTRHDWISLWWGDQAWFWSKPILNFWLQATSFSWFGIDPSPEAMLGAVARGRWPAPEWAARLPNAALALGGAFVLHRGLARAFGRRAASFGALLLIACPYWFFLARQTMVDMTMAGPLAACIGFCLLAAESSDDELARVYRVELGTRALRVSARELTLGCIAALSLVQSLYLLSRHVGLAPGLSFHVDRVWSGSPGNCGLPGNAPCQLDVEATGAWLQPGLAAIGWAACLTVLLWCERREQKLRGLYQLAAWVCVALAVMGKGAPGLVLPLASFVAWLALRGELSALRRAKLPALALILACVTAPWFVQAYARHGMPFFERLFLHDMMQRAFGHVHDTNAGVDTSFRYYLWQLGYGLFPWSGVAAAGALHAVARASRPETAPSERRASQLLVVWLLAGFGMFGIAGTKFHHYALPLVPAAAALGGAWLAALWDTRSAGAAALALLAAVSTLLAGLDLAAAGDMPGAARLHQLFTYLYSRPWPASLDMRLDLALFAAAASLASLGLALGRPRRVAIVGLCGVGVVFAVWAVDVYLIRLAPHWGQRENIAAYYATRQGPDEPLVAYRQNWMGENFYTGNHVATFKSAGKPFEAWIAAQRRDGRRVLFFTTEHDTLPALKGQLGKTRRFDLLTTAEQNNKFVLARVEL
jgi:4-amino-4-deoxy-L-arabinose transferase-like glycosyltransferase